jgi:hypothetical protein
MVQGTRQEVGKKGGIYGIPNLSSGLPAVTHRETGKELGSMPTQPPVGFYRISNEIRKLLRGEELHLHGRSPGTSRPGPCRRGGLYPGHQRSPELCRSLPFNLVSQVSAGDSRPTGYRPDRPGAGRGGPVIKNDRILGALDKILRVDGEQEEAGKPRLS